MHVMLTNVNIFEFSTQITQYTKTQRFYVFFEYFFWEIYDVIKIWIINIQYWEMQKACSLCSTILPRKIIRYYESLKDVSFCEFFLYAE